MARCLENCKWMCITAYIVAAIGALICAYNHLRTSGNPIILPKWGYYLVALGALVTLYCAITWAAGSEIDDYKQMQQFISL